MNFLQKLDEAINKVVEAQDRPILFGRYETISQLPGAVNLGSGVKGGKTKLPNSGEETEYRITTNPDLLTVIDQDSKLRGFGTNNCITCVHFIAGDICPMTKKVLNQDTVTSLSNGGCGLHNMLPPLNDGSGYPNQLMDEIVETVLDSDKAIVYRNGKVKELDLVQDLGIRQPSLMKDQEANWRDRK